MSLFYAEARAAELEGRADRVLDERAVWMEGEDVKKLVESLRSSAKSLRMGGP